jgi:hypothetical protein
MFRQVFQGITLQVYFVIFYKKRTKSSLETQILTDFFTPNKMPKDFKKSTKTRNRFSTLISGNSPSLISDNKSSSSKRNRSDSTQPLSKRRKGKDPVRVPNVISSSSRTEKESEVPEDFSQKLDTIFNQNLSIIEKINKLLTAQDQLEECVINLEESIENMNKSRPRTSDKPFVNVIKSF